MWMKLEERYGNIKILARKEVVEFNTQEEEICCLKKVSWKTQY